MIRSMTAFARQEAHGEWGTATWEIRSINHRYLDVYLRLPENFGHLEPILRDLLRAKIQRGKIEITFRYQQQNTTQNQIVINKPLVQQLISAVHETTQLAKEPIEALFNPIDILRWPGVVQSPEINTNNLEPELLAPFKKTLDELIQARQREGKSIQEFLHQRLADLKTQIESAQQRLPSILSEQREKTFARFEEAKLALDPSRLEQEMVLFAQKIDVAEELSRLETHISEFARTLEQPSASGRRLDFLLQELNREANTLGSKSVSITTTMAAVELKVLIDQMREQVQNVE